MSAAGTSRWKLFDFTTIPSAADFSRSAHFALSARRFQKVYA
jgi:hypothetical protein